MRKTAWIASLLVLFAAPTAFAEGPQQPPPPQQGYGQQPPPQQGQGQQQAPQQAGYGEKEAPSGQQGRGIEYGLHLLLPIWVTTEDAFDVGFGVQGRVGWEFPGGFTTELNIGYMRNGVSGTDVALDNVWIGAGARYSFFNPSAFVPFVGAGIKLNFWGIQICGPDGVGGTVCASGDRELTVGFVGTVGAAYEFSPWAAVEFGLNFDYTLPGDAFADPEAYVSPFVGGTLYY